MVSDNGIVDDAHQSWHVEGVAQVFVPLFGDVTFAMNGSTGLMMSGSQAGVSYQGSGRIIGEGGFSVGRNASGGVLGYSGDSAEQFNLVLEQGVISAQFLDGLLDFGQLSCQGMLQGNGGLTHGFGEIGDEALSVLAIGPLALGGAQGVGLNHQSMELLQGKGFWLWAKARITWASTLSVLVLRNWALAKAAI